MNGGSEGWQMIRCAGGAHDKSVMNRIMLRFRPIAPKPAASGSDVVSGGFGSDNNSNNNNTNNNNNNNKSLVLSKGLRKKRKYVRVRRNTGYTRKKKPAISGDENIVKDAADADRRATLQLLPEKSDLNLSMMNGLDLSTDSNNNNTSFEENRGLPVWLNGKKPEEQTRVTDRVLVVHTWVTVECVRGSNTTCMNNDHDVDHHYHYHQELGSTDVERERNLDKDTCPGFISDGLNRVMWVNGAFRKMVVSYVENDGLSPEIMVGLVIKEKLPAIYSSLTGHVKLQYTILGEGMRMEKYSQIVPCDLWRMDGGGFAWRLDVEAALTLGR